MTKRTINSYLQQFNITEEYLRDAYINKQLSLPDIKKEKGIHFKACSLLLRHFNIPIRTISESRLTKVGKIKIKQSFVSKLGVENPSQLESVKEKKRRTFIKNYGVDNIWKSKKYYEWLDNYMVLNYGRKRITPNPVEISGNMKKWWENLSVKDKEKKIKEQLKKLHKASSFENRIEMMIAYALDNLGISYERFYLVGRLVADFYIKQFNLIIECNGDFWHANPIKYKAEDVLNFPGKSVKVIAVWEKDKKKIDVYKKRGYGVITLWESDIKHMHNEHTLSEFIIEKIKNEN